MCCKGIRYHATEWTDYHTFYKPLALPYIQLYTDTDITLTSPAYSAGSESKSWRLSPSQVLYIWVWVLWVEVPESESDSTFEYTLGLKSYITGYTGTFNADLHVYIKQYELLFWCFCVVTMCKLNHVFTLFLQLCVRLLVNRVNTILTYLLNCRARYSWRVSFIGAYEPCNVGQVQRNERYIITSH